MSLNPLNELKRRLDDDTTPLPKRLCLAKNVIRSHHFATAPKERVVAEWLEHLTNRNELTSNELRDVIGWLDVYDDLTSELKSQLIRVVSQYLQSNSLEIEDVPHILSFLEHVKMSTQLTLHIDDYLLITVTILQYLKSDEHINLQFTERVFNNIIKYYKECKKKLEFILKLLGGENLETIFSYLDTEYRNIVINVCQSILFPMNKKSFFVSFLQTLIRKDNIDELLAEKGDNIQSVLKIMSAFFTFPKGRTGKEQKFLSDFINVFVSCFKNEGQLIFAFYIMVVSSLNMNESYLSPAMKMPPIIFEENDDKVKRSLFLNMLKALHSNEIDINVKLTDTFGEKISKVEIKKNFTSFLQTVMLGQLKLEGKLDKATLQIIQVALKLDPILIEQKMEQILPPIMTAKKNTSGLIECYTNTLCYLLETLFKLSKGMLFVNQILPHVKLSLEASNTEQFELKQKIQEATDGGLDCSKLKGKLITGDDIFPAKCIHLYGKWTSELMFRQNKELLMLLQKDFEIHCLMMLEEGFVSPSIITLAEVLSAILCSFLRYNKMADHTVPQQIGEDFWSAYRTFEGDCLRKFGECVLKLNYNSTLVLSFLRLCEYFAQLKLLNIKYSNFKLEISPLTQTLEVLDLSNILPCLDSEQWIMLAGKLTEDEALSVLNNLLLLKTMAILLSSNGPNVDENQNISATKLHIIKQLSTKSDILSNDTYSTKLLFTNLDRNQLKLLAKSLVRHHLKDPDPRLFTSDAIANNRTLIHAIVLEVIRNMGKSLENVEDFIRALNKPDFDFIAFVKDVDIKDYFDKISLKDNQEATILNCIELLQNLPVPYVEETLQLITIFVLLSTKKCCKAKKIRKYIDYVLQYMFELSPKYPDLYKIFPVNFIFSFEDKMMIDLLTLKIKTSNNTLLIKVILESAVKKVKTNSEIVKEIVELLLTKQPNKEDDVTSIEYFSDPVFQIICIILPIIAKEKKAITTSAYRSILATLQDKLHKSMLESFKNLDFGSNSSLLNEPTGNIDNSTVDLDGALATLNALGAYSLTLSKYCETTDAEEIKNLDSLWNGLEFFVKNATQAIQNPSSKQLHVDSSIQFLNVVLRHIKKLESHTIFQNKDQIYTLIWKSIVNRSLIVCEKQAKRKRGGESYFEDMAVMLKFICELASVECFVGNFVEDLSNLAVLKTPYEILNCDESPSILSSHKASKYLWTQCLKANIAGQKCVALSKLMCKSCKALRFWIQEHYEFQEARQERRLRSNVLEDEIKVVKVEDDVCKLLRTELDTISEVVLAAKKIKLDYKLIDAIFEVQHLTHYILGLGTPAAQCVVSWQAFFDVFVGCMAVMNSLLVSREEILEDRWPCYMQCYRALVSCLCARAAPAQLERAVDQRLAEMAHSIEKLTQSICKRKAHISRIAAYTVADICALLETTSPSRLTRQHLENAVVLFIQVSDSSYAVAFLRRALAGSPGHTTMTNLYAMYKRYHKYVGNS